VPPVLVVTVMPEVAPVVWSKPSNFKVPALMFTAARLLTVCGRKVISPVPTLVRENPPPLRVRPAPPSPMSQRPLVPMLALPARVSEARLELP
jgi:hypothetical protein